MYYYILKKDMILKVKKKTFFKICNCDRLPKYFINTGLEIIQM